MTHSGRRTSFGANYLKRLRQVGLPLAQTHETAGLAARSRPSLGMDKGNAEGAAEFEPPKYLASLIAAINDGAKAAQGGALAFLLVGIYLLATAFSSSDEDLLRGKAVTISQIGASLPVSFSFAIAPLVFVFVHLYTLARYDMLAVNARHFCEQVVARRVGGRRPRGLPAASRQRRVPCSANRAARLGAVQPVLALVVPRYGRGVSGSGAAAGAG